MFFNPLTCSGFSATAGWIASGDCFKIRIGFIILFFCAALINKWGGEEMGINFSFLFSLVLGLLSYLVTAVLFGSFKISFIVGLIGALVGGYGSGFLGFGGEGGDDYG